jgi:hypothetical protein
MKLAKWGLAILLASPLAIPLAAFAQSQDSSQSSQDPLAAAARRAREEKKDAPKAAKVWDNDNIPSTPGTVSVVGESSGENSAASDQNAAPDQQQGQQDQQAANANAPTPLDDKEKAAKAAELDADKQQLESLKKDIDILQRKLVLDQQMYYIKPDYASDKAGAAALKDEQDQFDAKQQQVADLQKKIDQLQSEVSAASSSSGNSGGNSSGSSPSTNQNQ